jgi:glycosyltransferase involved in cell wall biosynthesis
MRVLITLPDLHFGGAANLLLRNLKSILAIPGIQLYIMYFGTNDTLKKRFEEANVTLIHINYHGLSNLLPSVFKIRFFVTKNKIDVIHTNLILDKSLLALATVGLKLKKITTIHSSQIERYKKRFKLKLLLRFERYLCNDYYYQTVVVSKAAMESAINERGIKAEKLTLIYNGIIPLAKIKSNVDADGITFITACRLIDIKGIDRLIKVFAKIDNHGKKHKLVIMGDGPLMDDLKKLCLNFRTQDNIIFDGFVEKIEMRLNASHYYVNSSYSEAMPISVLEAMSVGKPIIASNVGGLSEIVKNGLNGYLIDFNDELACITSFNEIIENHKANYEQLSRQSEMDFMENYSSESYVSCLMNLYNVK